MEMLLDDEGSGERRVLRAATLCPIHLSPCDEAIENDTSPFFPNETFVSSNGTSEIITSWSSIVFMCITSALLGILIIATVVGNVFVIVAVFIEKNLRNVANYLVVSLAVADLMVACLVMPLGAIYEQQKITHGDLCILVWLVIIPIEDHIARFYKDFPDFENLGLGFWILGHASLHCLVIIWFSFGLVVGSGEDRLGNITGSHLMLGLAVTFAHHLGFCTALFRDIHHGERAAFMYVLIHSMTTYAAYIIACIMVWVSKASSERKLVCVGLLSVRIVGVVASVFLEGKQDNIRGVFGHRAQFPILQRIKMDEPPPYACFKVLLLAAMVAAKLGLCVYVILLPNKIE